MQSKQQWLDGFKEVAKPPFMHQVRERLKDDDVAAGIEAEHFDNAFEQLTKLVESSPYHTDVWFATMACIEAGTLIYGKKEGKCPQPDPLTT